MTGSTLLRKLQGTIRSTSWAPEEKTQAHSYLHGIRGLLAISSIAWIFLQTFVPATVSNETDGPPYQKTIRYVFAPLLWNESLISAFFFTLSARSICVRFLEQPKSVAYAGSIIRRIIRMSLAVGLASGIASGIFRGLGTDYILEFQDLLPNRSINAPRIPNNGLTALNSMFDMFWVVRVYYYQAANRFWPSMTIWNLSLIYQQSWTVYFLMLLLPYTREGWHIQGLCLFALGSFWMNSWGWYDATALLLADYVITAKLKTHLQEGLKIGEYWKLPFAVPAVLMAASGIAFKYCWTIFPQYTNKMLVLHPYLDLAENTSRASFVGADPFYPRLDDYLVIFGLLLLVETTTWTRKWLAAKWLVWLGKRSLSEYYQPRVALHTTRLINRRTLGLFVAQSLIFWTAGIKLYLHLYVGKDTSSALANLAVFLVCTIATLICSEIYYCAVDLPSQWIAWTIYSWLRR